MSDPRRKPIRRAAAASVLAASLIGAATASADSQTFYFKPAPANPPGTQNSGLQQRFVVPPGVASIEVKAAGGTGGSTAAGTGRVSGGVADHIDTTIGVNPGLLLYVDVGGAGATGLAGGGWNGGGAGGSSDAGGGGGASDVRTCMVNGFCDQVGIFTDASARLLAASGGGGAGATGNTHLGFTAGGAGGGPGVAGGHGVGASWSGFCSPVYLIGGSGGGGATPGSDGNGGAPNGVNGSSTIAVNGGAGGQSWDVRSGGGGGGGGGWRAGGGGGAGGAYILGQALFETAGGGGGGGGSSYGPSPYTQLENASPSDPAFVALIWSVPTANAAPATDIGPDRATLHGSIDPNGKSVASCAFNYQPSDLSTPPVQIPCAEDVASATGTMDVSATIASGLTPNTSYDYWVTVYDNAGDHGDSPHGTLTTTTA